MTEFEAEDISQSLRKSKAKKFKELNKKWKKTLDLMKTHKEEQHEEIQQKRISEMKKKKSAMNLILKENEEKKKKQLEETKDRIKDSEEQIHRNIIQNAERIEKERLENERKTMQKLNKISEHRKQKILETKENFLISTSKSLENFKINHQKVETENEQKHDMLKVKAFENFAEWVIFYFTLIY